MDTTLQHLPAVDRILDQLEEYTKVLPRKWLREMVRTQIDRLRSQILSDAYDGDTDEDQLEKHILSMVRSTAEARKNRSLRPVINATGIVLHTGLGRAPYSEAAQKAVRQAMAGYVALELDMETGSRGQRNDHTEDLFCALTGASEALVVNNNAAAVLLALNSLANGKETIISRGQLVEIGGSFRLPEVMKKSGAIMVEVGTTNRTHLEDYKKAITAETSLILVAHTSNYRVEGFTTQPALSDIVEVAHAQDIPVMFDLGSGALVDLEEFGLPSELVIPEIVQSGVDVISFSGDKLLGGPQAGILVGQTDAIHRMKTNPLTRALRCDKLTLSAMEATLLTYSNQETLTARNRTMELLTTKTDTLRTRGNLLLDRLPEDAKKRLKIQIVDASVEAGSGSLPTEEIPGVAISIQPEGWSADRVMQWMRRRKIPVVGYIQKDVCYFNLRTVFESQMEILLENLRALAEALKAS